MRAGIRTPGGSGDGEKDAGIGGEVVGECCGVVDVVLVIPEDGILYQDLRAELAVKLGLTER